MHSSLLHQAPLFHSLPPYAPTLHLLRAFYASWNVPHYVTTVPSFVPVMRIRTFQLCTERPRPAPVSMAPMRHGHIGRERFRDPAPPSSYSHEDVGFGGSAREMPRYQLPAPRLRTS
jgi:hypothetical protein